VIDDDCSPDSTADIIKRYKEKYPNIINENLRDKNVGSRTNFVENLKRANGEYIALCEGDDYWTDPLKIQKQVEFLVENEEYILVSANVKIIYERDNFKRHKVHKNFMDNFDFSVSELMILDTSPIATLTTMFRNDLRIDYSKIPLKRYWAGDKQLWMYLMQFGYGRYINEIVGVYRKHSGGITSNLGQSIENKIIHIQNRMSNHEEWNRFYNYQYNKEIEILKHKENTTLTILFLKNKEFYKAICSARFVNILMLSKMKYKIIVFVLKILNKVVSCTK
jgi:glycosyltransferase involved in cell wall biosynthesis